MVKIMGIINLTPDSFWESSRYNMSILDSRAEIVDVGAVSTRPGAADVTFEEEWSRLEPFLQKWKALSTDKVLSVDTTRSDIVRRVYDKVGAFIVNDISAGEDDPAMLETVGSLGLEYIAMHKRGNPRTMDALADLQTPVMEQLSEYFARFAQNAKSYGINKWVLDPGLGFAKTKEQNIEIVEHLDELKKFGRPILVGAADKRFTEGNTEKYHLLALERGADILRVHDVDAAYRTYARYEQECEKRKQHPV